MAGTGSNTTVIGSGPGTSGSQMSGGGASRPDSGLAAMSDWTEDLPEQPTFFKFNQDEPFGEKIGELQNVTDRLINEQKAVNERNCINWTMIEGHSRKCEKSIVIMQREIGNRSFIMKGIPLKNPAKKVRRGNKDVYVSKEKNHETLEIFVTKVLPALKVDPSDIRIEFCSRHRQNPRYDSAPHIRVRLGSPQDRHTIFSSLKNLQGNLDYKYWHFSQDFPEFLGPEVREAEFIAAEYRARHKECNTNIVIDQLDVKVQYRSKTKKNGRPDNWTTMTSDTFKMLQEEIKDGKGVKGKVHIESTPQMNDLGNKNNNIHIPPTPRAPTAKRRRPEETALNDSRLKYRERTNTINSRSSKEEEADDFMSS